MLDGKEIEMAAVGMCAECSKRALCRHLCPEANAYANQDQIFQREETVGIPFGDFKFPDGIGRKFTFTKRQAELLSWLVRGKSRLQVCRGMKIDRREYHRLLNRMRQKYQDLP